MFLCRLLSYNQLGISNILHCPDRGLITLSEGGYLPALEAAAALVSAIHQFKRTCGELGTIKIIVPPTEDNLAGLYKSEIRKQEGSTPKEGIGGKLRKAGDRVKGFFAKSVEEKIEYHAAGDLEVTKLIIWARNQSNLDHVINEIKQIYTRETDTTEISDYAKYIRDGNITMVNILSHYGKR